MSLHLFLDEGRPVAELPIRAMSKRPKVMHLPDDRWRAQLGEVAAALEALQFRLLGVHASLPSDQEPDPFSSLRAGIECVLADRLAPAAEALRGLIAEEEGPPPDGEGH